MAAEESCIAISSAQHVKCFAPYVDIQKNALFGGGGVADVRFVQPAFRWKCSDSEKDNYEDTTKGLVNCIRCSDFTQVKQVEKEMVTAILR